MAKHDCTGSKKGKDPKTNKSKKVIKEPEKAPFEFNASDEWVEGFMGRHNIPIAPTVGEMGSSDHEGAKTYVNDFLGFPEDDWYFQGQQSRDMATTHIGSPHRLSKHHEEATQELFIQLKTQEPSDNGPKKIESSETDQSFDKQSDDELDNQNNVELNKQSDDELDIDCIRTQLNSLPCKPGGKCCCNTDFSTQVPEYIVDLFNIMPENNIIIVDNDKILYL